MRQIHSKEKQQFRELFLQENIDRFEDRYAILDVFLQIEGHVTISDVMAALETAGRNFPEVFVSDTMQLMCRYGFAYENRFGNGDARYEHRHLGQHHDHMICTKCGRIVEFTEDDLESLQENIAAAYGFHLLQHRMELYGICDICRKEQVQRLPLIVTRPGERVTIMEITGGTGTRMRLMAMGLRVGDVLDIITNMGEGQVVVAVAGKRYALGRGLSRKIVVAPQVDGGHDESRVCETLPCVPMSLLEEGQRATIARVGGHSALRRRLLEMGFLKGVEVVVEKYAPLRDPLELVIKGAHISLRVDEAENISVENIR
ncbi:MAG: FeoA domain-containing protein [Pseudomonadota bacterium]